MTFARRRISHFAAASAIALAWSSIALAADFTIDNVRLTPKNDGATVTIRTIQVRGSNLSKEDFARIYDPATPKEQAAALAKKLQVESVSAPEIVFTRADDKPGVVTLRGYQMTKYNQGKFARFSMAGVEGKFRPEAGGGDATIKSGPLTIEDADISRAIDAAMKGDLGEAAPRLGKFEFRDFEVRFPEKSAAGDLMHTFRLGALLASQTYQGEHPLKGLVELRNVVFIPAPQSGAAAGMGQFGYKQIDIGLKGEGVYNAATKAYELTDLTINGVNAGALSLRGLFGNIGPEAFNGGQLARIGALMAGEVSNISLRYADNGLFDKALVFFAQMNGKDPMAVRQEWAGMIAGILPIMTGGDPGAMKVATAISEFIRAPKSLAISIKSKNGPVRFADLQQLSDPAALFKQIEIEASANR